MDENVQIILKNTQYHWVSAGKEKNKQTWLIVWYMMGGSAKSWLASRKLMSVFNFFCQRMIRTSFLLLILIYLFNIMVNVLYMFYLFLKKIYYIDIHVNTEMSGLAR